MEWKVRARTVCMMMCAQVALPEKGATCHQMIMGAGADCAGGGEGST